MLAAWARRMRNRSPCVSRPSRSALAELAFTAAAVLIDAAEAVLVTGVVAALAFEADNTLGGLPDSDKLPRRRESELGVEGCEEVGGCAEGVAVTLVPDRPEVLGKWTCAWPVLLWLPGACSA